MTDYKNLSPEYFKRVAETIWRHKWDSDFAYRSLFRKFNQIFNFDDIKEFNEIIIEFKSKYFFTPMDIEKHLNHMILNNRIIRVRKDGQKYYLDPETIMKELENIIRWCYKKLNKYYKLYGINIDGIDITEMDSMREFN